MTTTATTTAVLLLQDKAQFIADPKADYTDHRLHTGLTVNVGGVNNLTLGYLSIALNAESYAFCLDCRQEFFDCTCAAG